MAGNEVTRVEVTSDLTDEVSDELKTGAELTTGESVMWKPASISLAATLFLFLLF